MSEIGEIDGIKIMLSKEQYEEYKGMLNEQLENANKEIERLNKELEKYKYTADELNEIERLNNIINELEKWLKDYIKLFDKPDMLEEQTLEDLKEVLDKLQELKGE